MRAHIFLSYTAASAVLGLGCQMALATEITVVASHGSVSVTQSDHLVPVSASKRLTLPAQVKTGSDGTLDLKDNDSLIHIGPNSTVALPDTGPAGSLVDRYLQSAGSALYNIQSRHGRPMSVETPYLVSVVKGTVFTIAVEDGATSVTLLEGSLDVSAPGVRQHVLLKANQSIRHSRGESSLTVKPIGAAPEKIDSTAKIKAPLPDEVDSAEVALVTRDLAEVGAAVSAQHAALSASVAHGFAGSSGIPTASRNVSAPGVPSSGTTSSDTDASGSTTSGSSNDNSAPSGSSPGSSPTGTTSGASGDNSSGPSGNSGASGNSGPSGNSGSNGNSGPSGNSGSSGNSKNGSSGNDDDSVIPKLGCNGKTNGTGQGRCLGHGKNKT